MENPIILVFYWFENFCLIAMGGVLFNYFSLLQLKTFCKVALINAILLYVLRNGFEIMNLPVNSFVRMGICLILFVVILYKFGNVDLLVSSLTGILGYTVLLFNDMTMVYYYIQWFKIPVEKIATNIFLHLKLGLLSDMTFVFIIVAIVLVKQISNSIGVRVS